MKDLSRDIRYDISINLKILMAKNNIRTFTELEKRSKVSRVTISKAANGKRVSWATLVGLAEGLSCDVTELIRDSKEVV